ncbi:MAG: hypothetical protein ACN6I5_06810 [Hyphomicrobiales bacterium]
MLIHRGDRQAGVLGQIELVPIEPDHVGLVSLCAHYSGSNCNMAGNLTAHIAEVSPVDLTAARITSRTCRCETKPFTVLSHWVQRPVTASRLGSSDCWSMLSNKTDTKRQHDAAVEPAISWFAGIAPPQPADVSANFNTMEDVEATVCNGRQAGILPVRDRCVADVKQLTKMLACVVPMCPRSGGIISS